MSTATVAALFRNVVPRGRDVLRVMDVLKDESAVEVAAAVSGASIRRIVAADVPGASAYGLSRAINGADSNPLYRLAAVLVLMKRLGMGREKAQRLVDFLQAIVDALWPVEAEKPEQQQRGNANNEATK